MPGMEFSRLNYLLAEAMKTPRDPWEYSNCFHSMNTYENILNYVYVYLFWPSILIPMPSTFLRKLRLNRLEGNLQFAP